MLKYYGTHENPLSLSLSKKAVKCRESETFISLVKAFLRSELFLLSLLFGCLRDDPLSLSIFSNYAETTDDNKG